MKILLRLLTVSFLLTGAFGAQAHACPSSQAVESVCHRSAEAKQVPACHAGTNRRQAETEDCASMTCCQLAGASRIATTNMHFAPDWQTEAVAAGSLSSVVVVRADRLLAKSCSPPQSFGLALSPSLRAPPVVLS